MKALDWVSLGTGVFSFGLLVWIGHWWSAGAVGLVLVMHVRLLLIRLPRPPGSGL